MTPNRREILGAGLVAGAAGLAGIVARPVAAHTGTLPEAEWKKLAEAPKSKADFRKLSGHFNALRKGAEEEARYYQEVAQIYRRKGIAGCTESQAHDAARALEHVAEHARDTAEALEHLVETYDGLEENFKA